MAIDLNLVAPGVTSGIAEMTASLSNAFRNRNNNRRADKQLAEQRSIKRLEDAIKRTRSDKRFNVERGDDAFNMLQRILGSSGTSVGSRTGSVSGSSKAVVDPQTLQAEMDKLQAARGRESQQKYITDLANAGIWSQSDSSMSDPLVLAEMMPEYDKAAKARGIKRMPAYTQTQLKQLAMQNLSQAPTAAGGGQQTAMVAALGNRRNRLLALLEQSKGTPAEPAVRQQLERLDDLLSGVAAPAVQGGGGGAVEKKEQVEVPQPETQVPQPETQVPVLDDRSNAIMPGDVEALGSETFPSAAEQNWGQKLDDYVAAGHAPAPEKYVPKPGTTGAIEVELAQATSVDAMQDMALTRASEVLAKWPGAIDKLLKAQEQPGGPGVAIWRVQQQYSDAAKADIAKAAQYLNVANSIMQNM